MNKKTRPELGQKCTISTTLYRTRVRSGNLREWKSEPMEPCEAWYIGWRTRQNGKYDNGDWDQWAYLIPTEYVEVWLFVTNPRHNHIAVFPKDVEVINE